MNHINRKTKCKFVRSGSKCNKGNNSHYCKICDKEYNRKDALIQHKKTKLHANNLKKINNEIKNNHKINLPMSKK